MALNGIQITTRIPESVIEGIAEYVAEWITDDYSEEACEREGTDSQTLIRKLQADPDFRKIVELEMLEVINGAVQEPYDNDVPQEVHGELVHNQSNHWIAKYISRLHDAEQALEVEESIQQEVEREQSIADALALLEKRGIQVQKQDTELAEALRIAQAAGYKVEA